MISTNEKEKEKEKIFISRETIKRLIKDIKELNNFPLDSEGIFYKHCEEDIMQGYACIVGPKDSLYFGGYYFFHFYFPSDYPHSPPKVKFCTNNGFIRFHPNLYKNGKVCLSILNTWKGEQWSGCQSIKSVLLTILSILDKTPLLHEPGINENHKDFLNYNKLIKYYNNEFSIIAILQPEILKNHFKKIYDFYIVFEKNILESFKKNKNEIIENLNDNFLKLKSETIKTSLYNHDCSLNYKELIKKSKILLKI